jgi:hypothetical protein
MSEASDEEVEAVARALCAVSIDLGRKSTRQAYVNRNWPAHVEKARAAICALDSIRGRRG